MGSSHLGGWGVLDVYPNSEVGSAKVCPNVMGSSFCLYTGNSLRMSKKICLILIVFLARSEFVMNIYIVFVIFSFLSKLFLMFLLWFILMVNGLSLTYCSIYLGWPCDHLLRKSCPLGFFICAVLILVAS